MVNSGAACPSRSLTIVLGTPAAQGECGVRVPQIMQTNAAQSRGPEIVSDGGQ
jgi:hypothetical protein